MKISAKNAKFIRILRNFENFMKLYEIIRIFAKIVRKSANLESGEVQRNANLVDLEKC